MDVKEVILDIGDYVTAKVLEGELGMGFINTHLSAIRTHIKEQQECIDNLLRDHKDIEERQQKHIEEQDAVIKAYKNMTPDEFIDAWNKGAE